MNICIQALQLTYFSLNRNLIKIKHCLILSVEDQVLEVDAMNFVGFIKIGLHILSSKTYFSHKHFAIQWSRYKYGLQNPLKILKYCYLCYQTLPLHFLDHKQFWRNKLIALSFVQDSIPNLSAMSIKTEQLQLVLHCAGHNKRQRTLETGSARAANGNKCECHCYKMTGWHALSSLHNPIIKRLAAVSCLFFLLHCVCSFYCDKSLLRIDFRFNWIWYCLDYVLKVSLF